MSKKVNGAVQLAAEMEAIRLSVISDELKARHWKAQYETAYYHLEFEKILPEYQALLDKKKAEFEVQQKELQEMINKMNEEAAKGNLEVAGQEVANG